MMGWYSIPALAALVLGNAYFFVFFVWCWIFFCSSASCCLDFKCRRDNPCQTIHAYGLMYRYIYAILILLLFFNAGPILIFLGQASDISGYAENYTRIVGFGLIPALWAMVFRFFLSGLHLTKVTLIITLTTVLLNIPLNYLLIFGKLGFP